MHACLALARDVYRGPVRINIGLVKDMWTVEVVTESKKTDESTWQRTDARQLAAHAPGRAEALKRLKHALALLRELPD